MQRLAAMLICTFAWLPGVASGAPTVYGQVKLTFNDGNPVVVDEVPNPARTRTWRPYGPTGGSHRAVGASPDTFAERPRSYWVLPRARHLKSSLADSRSPGD